MHLRHYLYLAAVALAALVVTLIMVRFADALCRKQRRRTPLELALLVAILLIGVTAIMRNQAMGLGKVTLAFRSSANDTNDQYVPYYLNMIRMVREGGLPLWVSSYGMGTGILSNQLTSMDPFNLILIPLCLWRGEGFLSQALAITFACRALVAGLLFSHLLTRYCSTPLARIFGAVTYGLGGYLFTEGQHYFFGTAWVFLPIILIALEWLMEEQKARSFALVSIVCAACICFSVYVGFMTLLFVPVYVALRLVVLCEGMGVVTYLKRLGLCALAVFSGCLLAGIVLVPMAYYLVSETGRVGGEQATAARSVSSMLTAFLAPREFMLLLSRMLGNGLISCGANYRYVELGGVNELEFFQGGLSCGVFVLLGQFAHWALTDTSRRQKVAILLGTACVAYYCLGYFLPSILTVFRYPTYRGCLLIDALLICAMSLAVEHRLIERAPARIPLVLSLLVTGGVLGWSFLNTVNARLDCAYYVLACVALAVLLVMLLRRDNARSFEIPAADTAVSKHMKASDGAAGPSAAIVVLICAVMASSVIADSFCELNLNPKNISPASFPRSAKSDKGIETLEALDYLNETDSSFYRMERTFVTWNKWNDALSFGYRGISSYNSSEDGDLTEFFFQLWPEAINKQTNNYSCYSFAGDVDNPQMMSLTGIRYVVSLDPLDYDWAELVTTTEHGAYVYRVSYKKAAISPLYLRSSAASEGEASAMSLEERRALLDTELIVEDKAVATDAAAKGTAVEAEVDLNEDAFGALSGTIHASADSLACLTVPHTADWIVTIDGKAVDTFRANYGFVGFAVSAGEHSISAYHRPAGLFIGAGMTAAGLVLTCLGAWLARRAYRSEKNASAASMTV